MEGDYFIIDRIDQPMRRKEECKTDPSIYPYLYPPLVQYLLLLLLLP